MLQIGMFVDHNFLNPQTKCLICAQWFLYYDKLASQIKFVEKFKKSFFSIKNKVSYYVI